MNPMKLKLLNEVLEHLSSSQGNDLKSLLDEERKPKGMEMGLPKEDDSMEEEMGKSPKGISIEKVSLMGKPKDKMGEENELGLGEDKPDMMPGEEEMTDDELEELLKKLC